VFEGDLGGSGSRLEKVAQRGDRFLSAGETGLEAVEVGGDQLVAGGDVGCREDCPDLVERHIQGPEATNDLGGRDLVGGVAAMAARRVDIQSYLQDARVRGLSDATIARRLAALRGLYTYAVQEGYLSESPAQWVRLRRATVSGVAIHTSLDALELEALLRGEADAGTEFGGRQPEEVAG